MTMSSILPQFLLLLIFAAFAFAQEFADASLGIAENAQDINSDDLDDLLATPTEGVKTICDETKYLTDEEREMLTEQHNKLRLAVAKGEANNYVGILPGAKNMYRLKYDCKMETKVQEALNRGEARITFNNGYGQNIAKFSAEAFKSIKKPQLLRAALESWYNPVLYYGIKNEEIVYDDARLYTFANMIHAKTLRFGCGIYQPKDKNADTIISCIYNLIGGYPKNVIYEKGTICKKAADCTTYQGSKCNKITGFCVYKGPVPHPGGGENTMCKGNKGMNDNSRQKVLETHNKLKSMLALGQVQNGESKNKLPSSSFMPKMIYDCATEAEAIKYSKTCSLIKSDESARPGYGENVFTYPVPSVDPVSALNAATESWWSQILKDSINNKVIFDEALKNKAIDQKEFTQMAWAKSVKLGCAVQTCDISTFVVCRYSPAGNILNKEIYLTGSVCSGCAPACNKTEGLCEIY